MRLFDVYGEDDRRPKLWSLLRDAAGTGKSIDLSPGSQLIDLVHVDDVASAYRDAFEFLKENTNVTNEIFGVFSGDFMPLKEIVRTFQTVLGKEIRINWGGRAYREREVMKPYNNYKKLPNWKQKVSIIAGLTKLTRGGRNILSFMPLAYSLAV